MTHHTMTLHDTSSVMLSSCAVIDSEYTSRVAISYGQVYDIEYLYFGDLFAVIKLL